MYNPNDKKEINLDKYSGGMRKIMENKIQTEKTIQMKKEKKDSMMSKIKADTERLKKLALATWDEDKSEEK